MQFRIKIVGKLFYFKVIVEDKSGISKEFQVGPSWK